MAKAVLFLVSEDAPFVTGHPLVEQVASLKTDEVRKPRAFTLAARHRHTTRRKIAK
jgi:hypothetical protein